jgi:acyl-CoA reductase-like NAD-dependent aldehyde dehydrogenase
MTTFTVKSPSDNQTLYEVNDPTDSEITWIYKKAKDTFEKIRELTVEQRVAETLKVQKYIIENKEKIITRIVQETGKCKMDALTSEIFGVLDVIEYYKKEAPKALADKKAHTPFVLMGKKSKIYHDPLGPILVISPWNYPFYLALVPTITAFLAGNSVIFKPSEITPLKGLLEEIFDKSGFMKEAIQVVYGSKDTGRRLIEAKPAKIFFTGSVNTGKKIMELSSKLLIPVDLELGGKDPMIVFDDVNLDRTANGALWGAFTNAGQSCTSVERVYVQEEIYSRFVAKLEEKVNQLNLAGENNLSNDKGDIDVGTMTAEFQVKIVEDHIQDALEKGAKLLCGGKREKGSLFFPPTILLNVNHTMKIANEETFGPVMPVLKFSNEEEVIKKANDSEFGLSASVWSKDLVRAERVARKLEVGNVSINNVMLTEGNPALPFGGVKSSGFGRYKGEYGLYTFTNIKSIIIDSQSAKVEANWYPYTRNKYRIFSDLTDALFSNKGSLVKTIMSGLKLESTTNKEKI